MTRYSITTVATPDLEGHYVIFSFIPKIRGQAPQTPPLHLPLNHY